ncbi:MAG: glutamine-hydrolyzing carbamoyl-phosphate synthase small subunit [Candidatus Methanoplasma sp.]|jgi:carbamoyl-phosphate synthase small subunit|nr:glutamine-hydrolyzing carbamoyl-phosphate synthase small subunit [Candidatus Methanoplasma sp.]
MAESYLVLEDGSVFEGEPFGYRTSAVGEVVFSTGMSGYQESLTDPSFRGQILVTTYPLIGNYGINDSFCQSGHIHARGLAVREYCKEPSPMYGGRTLDDFLRCNKVPGISGIDTRDLVIKIRTMGTLKGAITEDKDRIDSLVKELKRMPAPSESNLVAEVTCDRIQEYDFGKDTRVGLLDCGGKSGILRDLSQRFNVTVFPYDTPADVITESKIRGVLISNGPGDPSHPAILKTAAKTAADLSSRVPLFGICFGSQIVGIAMGGKTYKLKFGHRGTNQPVKYDGKVYITSQNHGFAVDGDSLDGNDLIVDQTNVNDGTVEGLRHKNLPIFTSQYHPEASPGPTDTSFLFDRFAKVVKEGHL